MSAATMDDAGRDSRRRGFAVALTALVLGWPIASHAGYSDPMASASVAHPDWEPALAALRAREYELAVEHLTIVLRGEPDNADAHLAMGEAQARLGRSTPAIASFREAARLDPQSRAAQRALGDALLAAGDREGAQAALTALTRLCGDPCPESAALADALQRHDRR